MGLHTCHPAEVRIQPKQVLDLATPEGCKAEFTWWTHIRTDHLCIAVDLYKCKKDFPILISIIAFLYPSSINRNLIAVVAVHVTVDVVTHANGWCGSMVFSGVCLSVYCNLFVCASTGMCPSVFCMIYKNAAGRITKLETEMFHHES